MNALEMTAELTKINEAMELGRAAAFHKDAAEHDKWHERLDALSNYYRSKVEENPDLAPIYSALQNSSYWACVLLGRVHFGVKGEDWE